MPTSMTVVATRTSVLPSRNRVICCVPLLGLSRPWTSPTLQVGPPRRQHFGHRRGRPEVGLLGLLDHRKHDVGLAPATALLADEVEDLLALRAGPHRSPDAASPRRSFAQGRDVEVSVAGQRQRARNRRRGEQQHVGHVALGDQCRTLLHAEAVLLVDDDQARAAGRRPPPPAGRASRPRAGPTPGPAGAVVPPSPPRSADQPAAPAGGPAASSRRVSVAACCSASSSVGAMSAAWKSFSAASSIAQSATTVLPVPDIAHEQAMHPLRRGHVAPDLADGALLVTGERPGQRGQEAGGEIVPDREGHTAPSPAWRGVGPAPASAAGPPARRTPAAAAPPRRLRA